MFDAIAMATVTSTTRALSAMTLKSAYQRVNRGELERTVERTSRGVFVEHDLSALESAFNTTQITNLINFISSREFSLIADRVISAALRSSNPKLSSEQMMQIEQSIRLKVDIDPDKAAILADVVVEHLTPVVQAHLHAFAKADMLSRTALVDTLPTAAIYASIDRDYCSVLTKLVALEPVYRFATNYNEQFLTLRDRMDLPAGDLTAKQTVRFDELFVAPRVEDITGSDRRVYRGNPGGGKSTLITHQALQIARAALADNQPHVAFLLRLREIAPLIINHRPIVACIEDHAAVPFHVSPPTGAIEYLLHTGRATVFFDGLDEIPNIADRKKVVEHVQAFATRYPQAPVVATSRKIGYELAHLDPEAFSVADILGFTADDVHTYADKRFRLDPNLTDETREQRVSDFMASTESIEDLRSNPLLLSLMCHLYRHEGWIPRNRPDLYERCSELLYKTWDAQRSIEGERPYSRSVKYSIAQLAEWMLVSDPAQEGIVSYKVIDYLSERLHPTPYEDRATAEDAAEGIITFCTGRAWVLSDVGADLRDSKYGFTHRTFMEYFTAVNIRRRSESTEDLAANLMTYIGTQNNEVIWEICVQMADDNRQGAADDLVSHVLNAASRGEISHHSATQFAVRAMQLCTLTPKSRRTITDAVCGLEEPSMALFADLLCAAPDNLATVSDQFLTRQASSYQMLYAQVYPFVVAAGGNYYDATEHRNFWTSSPVLTDVKRQVYSTPTQLVGIHTQPPSWWTLTRYAYDIERDPTEPPVTSIGLLTLVHPPTFDNLVAPSFITRLLQSVLISLSPIPTPAAWPVQITRELDPDECERLVTALLQRLGHSPVTATFQLAAIRAWPTVTPQNIPNINQAPTGVVSLILVLAAIQSDLDYLLRIYDQASQSRSEYWHQLLDNNFRGHPIPEYNVLTPVREFIYRWLGGGIWTVRQPAPVPDRRQLSR